MVICNKAKDCEAREKCRDGVPHEPYNAYWSKNDLWCTEEQYCYWQECMTMCVPAEEPETKEEEK